jgi:hypothetical protein
MVSIAVLYTTTEPKVVRNYVIALWLADIGHIATTGYVMGYDKFMDFSNYNPTTWGNVGVTVSDIYVNIWGKLLTCQGFPMCNSYRVSPGFIWTRRQAFASWQKRTVKAQGIMCQAVRGW